MAKKQTYKEALKAAEGKGAKKFVNREGYTVIKGEDGKMQYLHRLEMDAKPGEDVDHIKGGSGKKNNKKKNLRKMSHADHMKEHKMPKGM